MMPAEIVAQEGQQRGRAAAHGVAHRAVQVRPRGPRVAGPPDRVAVRGRVRRPVQAAVVNAVRVGQDHRARLRAEGV
ncbi:hypothetical protein RZS08_21060, partial [Arthrospira platensis SPKY1]|nr:hypothetical protein [Arthrospira platensis SPKY1]